MRAAALSNIGGGYLAVKNSSTFIYTGSGTETTTRALWMDSGAATISVSDTAGSLTINPTGGTRSQSFTKTGAGTLEIGGAFSGGASVRASGGTLRLTSAASSYSGTTTLVAGVLEVSKLANGGANSSIGASTDAAANLVFNGGALSYIGSGDTTNRAFTITAAPAISANGSGALTWSGASPTFTTSGSAYQITLGGTSTADNTWGTVFADNGSGATSLRKAGAGKWVLTGANTFSGTVGIAAGTLELGSAGTLGSGSYAGAITNEGTLAFSSSVDQVLSGIVSGAGSLTKSGAGRLTLSAVNTLSGPTTVSNGTVVVDGSLKDSALTMNAGTLVGSGTVGSVTFNAGSTLAPGNSPGVLTFSDAAWAGGATYDWELLDATGSAGTGWDLFSGTGTLTVNATSGNKYTISLRTLSGTTTPGSANNFVASSPYSWTIAEYGSMTGFDESKFLIDSTNFVGINGTFSLTNSGTTLVLSYNPVTTYVYTGATGDWSTSGNWSGGFAPSGTATLEFSGGGGTATNNLGSGTLAAVVKLTFTGSAGAYTLDGDPLTIQAAGIVNESANLQTVSNGVTLASTALVDAATAGLVLSGTVDNGGFSLTVTGSANTTAGVITGAGGLTKTGVGALTVTASNAYAGGTTLSAGTIRVGDDAGLGSGTATLNGGALMSDGGTARTLGNALVVGGNITLGDATDNGLLTFTGGVDLGGATRQVTTSSDVTISGSIVNGGLTKTGSGVLTLSAANGFADGVTLSAGTIRVGDNAALGSGTVTLNGGTLSSDGGTARTLANALSIGGDVTLGDATNNGLLTFSGSVGLNGATRQITTPSNVTLSGVVANGGLTKSGTGTLRLSNANTYTLGTTIVSGTVVAADGTALGASGTVTLNTAATDVSNTGLLIDAGAASVTIARAISVANEGSGISTIGSGSLAGSNQAIFSGAITLAKDLTLFGADSGDRTQFSGGISGTGGVTVTTAGSGRVLFLTTANTYSGSTTVSAGSRLQLGEGVGTSVNFIPDASNVTVESGAQFNLAKGNNSESINALLGSGTVQAVSGVNTLVIGASGGSGTFSGVLRDSGGTLALTKQGGGSQTLSGSSSYTGGTTLTSGSLVLGNAAALGATSGSLAVNGGTLDLGGSGITVGTLSGSSGATITTGVAGSAVLTTDSPGSGTYAGAITDGSGTVRLVKSGAGTLTLTGANSFSGGMSLANGILSFANGSLGSGTATLGGGTLRWEAGNTEDVSSRLALVNSTTTTLDVGSNAVAFATGFGGGATAGIIKAGSGALTLSASNSFSGGTRLNAGQLNIGNAYAIGTGTFTIAGGTIDNSSGGSLVIATDNPQSWAGNFTFAGTHPLNLGAGAVALTAARTVTVTSSTLQVGGGISGAFNLTKAGAGTLTLAGMNNYTGVTIVTAGTLAFTGNNSLGNGLESAGSGNTSGVVSFGAHTITVGNPGTNAGSFYYGTLAGSGTLALRGGDGTVANANGTAGTVAGNYQIFSPSTALSPTAFGLDTGVSDTNRRDFAYLNDNSTVLELSSLSGYGAIRNDAAGNSSFPRLITVNQAIDTTFDGALLSHRSTSNVVRALSFEKQGVGALTLAGFIGKQTASANGGAAPVNLTANGGLLEVTNPSNTTTTNTDAIRLGTVTITSGTLAFSAQALINNAGSAGATSILMNGGVLRWNAGTTQDLTAGVSSRLTLVSGSTATFDTNGNDVTLANALGGGVIASPVVKIGGGTLTLSGANLYTGDTTISGGTLAIGGAGQLGSGGTYAGAITNNAALAVTTSANQTLSGSIGGSGSLAKSGVGTLTLTNAANNFSGGSTISGGVLSYAAGALGTTGAVTMDGGTLRWESGNTEDISARVSLVNATTATFDTNGNAVTFANALGGGTAAALTKAGNGSLTLSASNGYTGTTTISGGTLALSGIGRIAAASAIDLTAAGATFDISGADGARTIGSLVGAAGSQILLGGNGLTAGDAMSTTFGGVISGSGGFTKAGVGVLTLSDEQTFTGAARVDAGTLAIGGMNTLAAASQIFVNDGATLDATAAGLHIPGGQLLGGYGLLDGNDTSLSFASGATLSPGGSVGSLDGDFTNATLTGGMTYVFEVNDADGTAGGPNGWDLFTNTGDVNLVDAGTSPIVIDLTSLAGSVSGSAANFDPTFNYAWKFVVAGSEISYSYASNPTWFTVQTSNFENTFDGSFYVARGDQMSNIDASGSSNELYVVYAAVPEPGTLALAGIGLAAASWLVGRKGRRKGSNPHSAG